MKSDNALANTLKAHPLFCYAICQTLLLVVFYFPWLNGTFSVFILDGTHFVEPLAKFVGESIRRLDFPLWNPLNYCGMPQTAIPLQGICYPFTWLFSLFSFNCTLALSMIFHQLVLGVGAYLLVSSYGCGIFSSLLAAISFAMSGYAFSMCTEFQILQSAAWCPLSFWGLRTLELQQLAEKRNCPMMMFWTAVFIGLQVLAGSPDISMVQIGLLVLAVIYPFLKHRKENPTQAKALLINQSKCILFGVFLASPMLLPTMEWLKQSRRQSGLSASETLTLSANWYDFLGVVLPAPLGDMQLRFSEFRRLIMPGQMLPYVSSCYLGPAVISSAIWSLFDKQWKTKALAALVLLALAVLALGQNTPIMPLILSLVNLPIRFPVKHMFFFVGLVSAFAAKGIDENLSGYRPFLASLIVWICLLALGAALASNVSLLPFSSIEVSQSIINQANAKISRPCIIYSIAGILLSLLGCLFVWRNLPMKCFKICVLIGACLSLFLFPYAHRAGQSAAGSYFQNDSAVARMIDKHLAASGGNKKDEYRVLGLYLEHFTVPATVIDENNPEHDNLKATINAYQYSRQVLRPNTNMDFGQLSSFGFEASCTGDYFNFLQNCYAKSSQARGVGEAVTDEPIAQLCLSTATRFVLTQVFRYGTTPEKLEAIPLLDAKHFNLLNEDKRLNVRLYETKVPPKRAYFCTDWRRLASHDEALNVMFEPGPNNFKPVSQPLIELDTGAPGVTGSGDANPNFVEAVSLLEASNNRVRIEVQTPKAGYLVLADQFYEGWCATVDGASTPICRANSFFRAVSLQAGKHVVEFVFIPKGFYAGLLITLIVLAYMLSRVYLRKTHSNESPQTATEP